VIEQAIASINQPTRERFATPDDVDLQVALAALQLRGIQMVWYDPAESAAAEISARSMLERALQARARYVPVLETYCRFLTATNHFIESLVACARTLSFDPWTGALSPRSHAASARSLRRRHGDVQASRPVRHAACIALDLAAWRRDDVRAYGPQ
jgi:hypothetical protein